MYKPFTDTIREVMAVPSPTQPKIELTLRNETNTAWSFSPLWIEGLEIDQDFSGSYTDVIRISFKMATAAYNELYDNRTGLLATVILTFADATLSSVVYDPEPLTLECRGLLLDAEDARRQDRLSEARVTEDRTVTIELVDKRLYAIRRVGFNGIFQDTTLDALMRYAVKSFESAQSGAIATVSIAPPDNSTSYKHLVVPPTKDISEIFRYLQDTYGVYMKGIDYYYSRGALYVYPPYETNPSWRSDKLQIYLCDPGDYAGSPSYHRRQGEAVLDVIVSGTTGSVDNSRLATENIGTSVQITRSAKMIDGWVETDGAGSRFADDTAMTIRQTTKPKGMSAQASNVKYATATDNAFLEASRLAEHQTLRMALTWAQAVPFLIKPGHPVNYHHAADGVATVTPGVVERVQYSYHRGPRAPVGEVYQCAARLTLRLKPDA